MTYLRVRRFWDYQNADAWKKAAGNKNPPRHPPWCKLFVHRDEQLDMLDVKTRLVFYELLRLATRYGNAIPNESEIIAKQISMKPQDVVNAVLTLLEGRWLQESKTARHSRKVLEKKSPQNREQEEDKETPLPPLSDEVKNGNIHAAKELQKQLIESVKM